MRVVVALMVGGLLAASIIAGRLIATNAAHDRELADVRPEEVARATELAKSHWDNPLQRMMIVNIVLTSKERSNLCTIYTVDAVAYFGLSAGSVKVGCDDGVTSVH